MEISKILKINEIEDKMTNKKLIQYYFGKFSKIVTIDKSSFKSYLIVIYYCNIEEKSDLFFW